MKHLLLILPGCFLAGLSAYSILSYLLVPITITLPLSLIISVLVFGLSKYYFSYEDGKEETKKSLNGSRESTMENITFAAIFVAVLVIITFFPFNIEIELFVSWDHIAPLQVIKIAAAILFTFFLPGYAVVMILDKAGKLTMLPRLLLAYTFSILITGLTGYIGASFGYEMSERRILIISPSILLLILFVVQRLMTSRIDIRHISPAFYYSALCRIWSIIRKKNSQLIVFASLFALVIFYTYYLNNGEIVVDQWFYHGRALLMSSQAYKDLSTAETFKDPYETKVSDINEINPPFFSALLSAFFNLSGSPSVNAYTSINALNIMPVFAFYYFFISWVHKNSRRAVMLAITLFMLSSGFGWVYVLYSTSAHITSSPTSIDALSRATDRTYDIGLPTTFINVGHPDVTTPFVIIALPAGFTLLGLVGQSKSLLVNSNHSRASNSSFFRNKRVLTLLVSLTIITAISFLGILSHDEFYLFIIIASTLILFIKPINASYSIFFASFLSAMLLVISVDFLISPTNYYTQREIFGIPLIALGFLYVSTIWAIYLGLYVIRISNKHKINSIFKRVEEFVPKIAVTRFKNYRSNRRTKIALRIVTASIIAYLYLFTLYVWTQVSDKDIRSHVKDEWNVPWYLYPVKFGLVGLLGLAFVVSYIFKKFEKEIFVFGMVALIAFLAGPYYDEHRFGKYIMTSLDAFAALLIYQIISSSILNLKLNLRPLITGLLLGSVIISSSLSVLMFAGYVELFTDISGYIEGGRRDFPTIQEFQLLNFLRDKVFNSKTYNIAVPEKEVDYSTGFITKIYGFSALPRLKLLQSPLTLNASTLEGFYNLLDYSDTRYIVFPKKDFIDPQRQGSQAIVSNSNNNNIIQFALDNFPKVYQDKNYTVLEVPPLSPSSLSDSNIALIYQRDATHLQVPLSNRNYNLPHNNERLKFEAEGINKAQIIGDNIKNRSSKDNIGSYRNTTNTIFSDDNNDSVKSNKGTIYWTGPAHQIQRLYNNGNTTSENESKMNYIESSFRIMDSSNIDKHTGKKIKYDDYNAGILWWYQNKEYNLSITKDGLELLQTPITSKTLSKIYKQYLDNDASEIKNVNETSPILLSQNQEVKREKGIWYNLKVVLLNDTVYVYVNDALKIKVPITNNASDHTALISKVGVRVFHDQAEFQPIFIGKMSELTDQSYLKQKVYNRHYYPLTMLSLSNMKYETFLENDLSAFSKRYVILPFDPSSDQLYDASRYLDYTRSGGNLIVINSDNDNVQGIFAKLLSIRPGNPTNFDGIISAPSHNSSKIIEKRHSITVSGVAQGIVLPHGADELTVKSYYVSNNNDSKNRIVAPFTIEKNYGKGKIIFVNAIGYFDGIFKNSISPNNDIGKEKNQFFMSLANVSNLIDLSGLQSNDYVKINSLSITSLPATRIIGDLEIASGETGKINSSSILLPDSTSVNEYHSFDLSLKELSISTLSKISVLNHKESNTITDLSSINKGDLNPSRINNGINNGTTKFQYKLQNVLIKDLILYGGPFEVTIYSTNSSFPIHLPTSSSYNDYIGVSIPAGFDIAFKLPNINSSYIEFELKGMADKKQTYQTVRIYGSDNSTNMGTNDTYTSNNEIYFSKVKADIPGIKSISVLMKHPEIRILKDERSHSKNEQVDAGNIAVSFKEDSHKSGPIEIKNRNGNIMAKVSYVDNYNRPYHSGIRTQFLTYLEQPIEIISDNGAISSPSKIYDSEKKIKIEMPGDISEYAKKHGMQIPWIRALSSDLSILLAVSIAVITTIALWRLLPRARQI